MASDPSILALRAGRNGGVGWMTRRRAVTGTPIVVVIPGAIPIVSNFIGSGTSYTLDVSLAGTVYIVANSSATLLSPATVKSNAVGLTGGSGYYNGTVASGSNAFTLTGTFTAGNAARWQRRRRLDR